MIYMPLKFFSWEWNIYSFNCQECWLLTTHISGSLGQKSLPFFLRLHSLFGTELIQWKVDKWVQRSNMLALKRQISKVIWTPKLTTGSVEAFASILQKQEKQTNKQTLLFCPTLLLLFLSIYFSQESMKANFYVRVYFQDNLI